MLLCDIGNSSFYFKRGDKTYKESVLSFDVRSMKEKVYFISVNTKINPVLKTLKNWIDISTYIDTTKYYKTMGIDRIVLMQDVSNAIIIDAGSAITVDIVKNNNFMGGFIYPGLNAMNKTYEDISPLLKYDFNFDADLQTLPKNSQDAISYGYLKTLYSEVMSHNLDIVLTGGDAHLFKKIFKMARVDEELIFKGMKKILENHSFTNGVKFD